MDFKKAARRGALGLTGLALGIQLIPGGRNHDNPPVTREPVWDSPRTRELAVIACFDCHSNETRWPWYSNIAPVSFFVQDHVEEGRAMLNFSAWDQPQKYSYEAARAVREAWMPLDSYLLLHGQAKLSKADAKELADGFERMFGTEKPAATP
jgi:hypothetical protein